MAGSRQLGQLQSAWPLAAIAVVVAALALGLVPLMVFGFSSGGRLATLGQTWPVLRFTLWQAALSTLLSIVPAIPLARALARQAFPGRQLLLGVLSVPLALPVIVAVLGLATVYGASGWLAGAIPFYGLSGILLAHVFFNLPLATRYFLEALESAPAESHRLAAQLGFQSRDVWRLLDWPVLRPAVPRVAALAFLLCAASFVIVLTLGGPSATTLEVAIYQSLRMDFDVPRALSLSLLQLALSAVLVMLAGRVALAAPQDFRFRPPGQRWDGATRTARFCDGVLIGLAAALVLPPLAAIAVEGLQHMNFSSALVSATVISILIASLTVCFTMLLAWPLAALQLRSGWAARGAGLASLAGFLVPPAVLATGWFLALRGLGGTFALSLVLVSCLNTLMALPFANTVLLPAMARQASAHDMLCAQLGISGWQRLRLIDMPALRSPLLQAMLVSFALSFGDLAAITLLGTQGMTSLPALIAREMGNYRSANAHGTALVLMLLCLAASLLAARLRKIS